MMDAFASNPRELIRAKCLLVDDLQENLLALAALLRQDGVDLFLAHSGEEALELLLEHEFALAILDVQMPHMDGFELAELMRGSERTRHIPLIFVTAGSRDEHRLFKGYEAGAVDFLYKPIEAHIFTSKVTVFFQLYRQQRQLAQQLQERSETLRLNEMFMAILGHDLRNPLQSIILSAQILQHSPSLDIVKTTATQLLSSGRWMSRLIDDMLDLTRARLGGGIALCIEPADLQTLLQQQLDEFEKTFPQRRLQCSQRGNLCGEWDPNRLAQVASNLIGNAFQHGEADTAVEIAIDGTAHDVIVLSFSNAGSIAPNVLPHLFDPFRGGNRLPTRKGGLGLGLYIVKQIIDAHRGHIEAQSDAGRTTFRIEIPRRSH